MTDDLIHRVETACVELEGAGQPIAFTAVAQRVGIGRATLYRRPELRALIEEHRSRAREAHTLSGLASELRHLRTSLEAVAAKVRHHEEALRKLTKDQPR